MKKVPFTFNDESKKNSYGFKIKTEGISLERFNANPICLNDHQNTTKSVLGKWIEVQVNNTLLQGVPEFDTKDADGAEVVRKVLNGTLRACSMGIFFEPEDLQLIKSELWLLKCELYEVSIVAVPSNANSVSLYNTKGELLTAKEVKQLCLKAKNYQFKHKNMELEELIQHLQLKADANLADVLAAIKMLETQLSASSNKNKELEAAIADLRAKQTARLKAAYTTEKALALKDGRIDATGVAAIDELAEESPEKGLKLLKALPKRKKIATELGADDNKELEKLQAMTWDALDKGNHLPTLQLKYRAVYVEKFKEKFGTEPKQ